MSKCLLLVGVAAVLSPVAGAPITKDADHALAADGAAWAHRLLSASNQQQHDAHDNKSVKQQSTTRPGSGTCMTEVCNEGCDANVRTSHIEPPVTQRPTHTLSVTPPCPVTTVPRYRMRQRV